MFKKQRGKYEHRHQKEVKSEQQGGAAEEISRANFPRSLKALPLPLPTPIRYLL